MKIIRACAVVAVLLLCSSACGGAGKEADEPASTPPSEEATDPDSFEATLEFWAPIDLADLIKIGMKHKKGEDYEAGKTPCKDFDQSIDEGTEVLVLDASGDIIGVGRSEGGVLGAGVPAEAPCIFPVTIPDIPVGEKFYTVEVGGSSVTLSEDEMRDPEMSIDFGYED